MRECMIENSSGSGVERLGALLGRKGWNYHFGRWLFIHWNGAP